MQTTKKHTLLPRPEGQPDGHGDGVHDGGGVEGNAQPSPRMRPGFWRFLSLDQLNDAEWEALCDGCGKCCLVKLEDEDTGRIFTTDVGCRLLDSETCRCADYANRFEQVSDCIKIDRKAVSDLSWLPPTCAYRLVDEGRPLYWWHHLVTGSRKTIHQAGMSVRGRILSEGDVADDDLPDRIVDWPERDWSERDLAFEDADGQ